MGVPPTQKMTPPLHVIPACGEERRATNTKDDPPLLHTCMLRRAVVVPSTQKNPPLAHLHAAKSGRNIKSKTKDPPPMTKARFEKKNNLRFATMQMTHLLCELKKLEHGVNRPG